jgi:serine/threonine protein phosphatase PrpC
MKIFFIQIYQGATTNDQTNSTSSPNKTSSDLANKSQTGSSTNLKSADEALQSSQTPNKSTSNLLSSTSNSNLNNCVNRNNNKTPSKYSQVYEERLKEAIRQGFLNLDEKIRKMPEFEKGEDKSGSTAVACLISPSHVYLINCGDSRSILVSDEKVVLSTLDHKPINPCERERIQNAGGSVMIQRVNGSLAVSRALGDYEYKMVENRGPCEQLVSPEPEIYIRERQLDKDEFVVLACDGIWDVMTNDELKDYVHGRLKVTDDLVKISNDILDMCLGKVSSC